VDARCGQPAHSGGAGYDWGHWDTTPTPGRKGKLTFILDVKKKKESEWVRLGFRRTMKLPTWLDERGRPRPKRPCPLFSLTTPVLHAYKPTMGGAGRSVLVGRISALGPGFVVVGVADHVGSVSRSLAETARAWPCR
jgi:hypothetical protein